MGHHFPTGGRGATVHLTTQYLDEADHLADRIAIVDRGQVIASGTSDELKAQVGGERLDVTVARGRDFDDAVRALRPHGETEPIVERDVRHVALPVRDGARRLPDIVRDLDAAGVQLDDLALRHPTLDDVFLTLTGHAAEETADQDGQGAARAGRKEEVV